MTSAPSIEGSMQLLQNIQERMCSPVYAYAYAGRESHLILEAGPKLKAAALVHEPILSTAINGVGFFSPSQHLSQQFAYVQCIQRWSWPAMHHGISEGTLQIVQGLKKLETSDHVLPVSNRYSAACTKADSMSGAASSSAHRAEISSIQDRK